MAVRIRLRREGRKKTPMYRIVVADSKSPTALDSLQEAKALGEPNCVPDAAAAHARPRGDGVNAQGARPSLPYLKGDDG